MIQLSFHGAMNSVGASAVLVDTGVEKILFDYGTKVKEMPPQFPIPLHGRPDFIFLSHCHLDHSGGIPLFFKDKDRIPIYAQSCTKELTELLLLDSVKIHSEYIGIEGAQLPFDNNDVRETIRNFIPIDYKKTFKLRETEVTSFDAGHIPGACMFHLKNEKSVLYTGDYKTSDTRLHKKADESFDDVNVLITESTYAQREHPDRKDQEKQLVRLINETISKDGIALITGFAVGRIQEILLILDKHGIDYPVYIDGMAKKATTIINRYRNLLKDSKGLDKALEKVQYIASERMRRKVIKKPCAILTTSGMLSGGPAIWFLKRLYDDRKSSLILTGWQMEGTPGKILLETGKLITEDLELDVRMLVKRLDFSAHLGKTELFDFIKKVNPEKVFCVHGDHTEEFAQELKEKGFDAVAPVANNRIFQI